MQMWCMRSSSAISLNAETATVRRSDLLIPRIFSRIGGQGRTRPSFSSISTNYVTHDRYLTSGLNDLIAE